MLMFSLSPQGRKYRYDHSVAVNDDIIHHLIQIDEDRYNGSYSGHSYTAWRGVRPDDLDAGDLTCSAFWDKWKDTAVFGGGGTPQQAFLDLIKKLELLGFYASDLGRPLLMVSLHPTIAPPTAMLYNSKEFEAWLKEVQP